MITKHELCAEVARYLINIGLARYNPLDRIQYVNIVMLTYGEFKIKETKDAIAYRKTKRRGRWFLIKEYYA